jgi:hypothetical protein
MKLTGMIGKQALTGMIAAIVALHAAAVARAAPQIYEATVEVSSPAGEELGRWRVTTPIDVEAAIEAAEGLTTTKVAVLVRRAPDPDCQQVTLRLERSEPGEPLKTSNAKAIACGEKPFRFDGEQLGAPAMTVTIRRIGS